MHDLDSRRRRMRVEITHFATATHFMIYWRDGGETLVRLPHELAKDKIAIFDLFYDTINPLPSVTGDRWQEFLDSGWDTILRP
jgi:hypothetical protein